MVKLTGTYVLLTFRITYVPYAPYYLHSVLLMFLTFRITYVPYVSYYLRYSVLKSPVFLCEAPDESNLVWTKVDPGVVRRNKTIFIITIIY